MPRQSELHRGASRELSAALLVGRFHALTAGQAAFIARLDDDARVDRIVCVLTSADHAGTRRNPLPIALRRELMSDALAYARKPCHVVAIDDVPETQDWVAHVLARVRAEPEIGIEPEHLLVFTANHSVDALFTAAGFEVISHEVEGPTPQELIQRIAGGRAWEADAAPSMRALYARHGLVPTLRSIYAQTLLNDDGELGHARDFASYGAQMDAALALKLEDILPHVRPGLIVDKGCGTGSLLVELSRRFPSSAFLGVDLSRELLRRCDANHYDAEDVRFVIGDIADRQVEDGTATCVVMSSVVHEIYSYAGYDRAKVRRAVGNAARELAPGGRFVVRDGVSAGPSPVRLALLNEATRAQFAKFAREFKHGAGAAHERISDREVRLSAHLANEFLCKKDYLKNWHIEVHEEYGTFTVAEWREVLQAAGLDIVELKAYVNPWIAEHRYAGSVALTDDAGAPLPWPATNVLAAAAKR